MTVVSEVYTPHCMHKRNRYMVDMADRLIAVYDGTEGGTRMTVKCALDKGIRVDVLHP